MVTMKSLGLDKLTDQEKLALAEELWGSVDGEEEKQRLTLTQLRDLKERLEAFKDNPLAGTPWEEVKAQILGSR
jgi:putative addiction module component (TIGR02574 family)